MCTTLCPLQNFTYIQTFKRSTTSVYLVFDLRSRTYQVLKVYTFHAINQFVNEVNINIRVAQFDVNSQFALSFSNYGDFTECNCSREVGLCGWITVPYAEQGSLFDLLAVSYLRIQKSQKMALLKQIALCHQALKTNGIVHGDIKLENYVQSPNGALPIDFGLSIDLEDSAQSP